MKVQILSEPALSFAKGNHIDIRAGITKFGTFDREIPSLPKPIGVGLVGTTATIDGVRDWLELCRNGVASKEEIRRELRPDFPGMRSELFGTSLSLSDGASRTVSRHELQEALSDKNPMLRVVELFMSHARDLAGRTGVHVLVIAPPAEVFMLGEHTPPDAEAELDEAHDRKNLYSPCFHDLFKAQALDLAVPCQIVRPDTYGGGSTRKSKNGEKTVGSLQDLATRAWNFHIALYYKAGGVPWRLARLLGAYSTCFVGTSFYKSADGERLLTSVAQVFDERGEGFIVQGGSAKVNKDDRSPHLSATDAAALLKSVLASYRREHKNMPARVVLHKTSYFDAEELDGFQQAARDERVDVIDLISVRRSNIRLFPHSVPPAIRGTMLQIDGKMGIVYLKGTVPYFGFYPGHYVPRALEFSRDDGEATPVDIAKEMLELSKLNFNNTQFDSCDPITVRAARRVGDILTHVSADRVSAMQSRFRYFT